MFEFTTGLSWSRSAEGLPSWSPDQGDSFSQSQDLAMWPPMDPHSVFFLFLDYSFFFSIKRTKEISPLWNYLVGHIERSVLNKMCVQRVIPSQLWVFIAQVRGFPYTEHMAGEIIGRAPIFIKQAFLLCSGTCAHHSWRWESHREGRKEKKKKGQLLYESKLKWCACVIFIAWSLRIALSWYRTWLLGNRVCGVIFHSLQTNNTEWFGTPRMEKNHKQR